MRILVVDDHDFVRRGICAALAAVPNVEVCGEAVDGRDAVKKAEILCPEVVVMDISMPNMNGLEATREIKRLLPAVEIVIVTQHDTPEMIRQAYNAGAGAYVMKSAISTELLSAIEKVRQRSPLLKNKKPVDAAEDRSVGDHLRNSAAQKKVLRESDELFQAVMNNMAEGLFILDVQGKATYVNASAEKLLGWTAAELLGKDIHDIVHYHHPDGTGFPAMACPSLRVLQDGTELREYKDAFLRKDQAFFSVVLNTSALKSGGGTIGAVVCFRDETKERIVDQNIQEQKETEGKLIQLVQTLEAKVSDRTRELENVEDRLTELSAKLLQTQDEERRRIARELHDGIGQLLAALNMNLAQLTSERDKLSSEGRKFLDENAVLIEQASREVRTMSHLLHPPLLDEVGLESALRWYIEGFSERSRIAVRMELEPDFGKGLPRDLALALFRIVQECLVNVHRHSGSPTAMVTFVRSPSEITLRVQDEGHGILPEIQCRISSDEGSGVGLRGMRERLRQFGGHLEFHSDEKGTRITAVLPVPTQESGLENRNGMKAGPTTSTERPHRDARTILCIDDEAAGLLPRKLLLQSAGYHVIEARSGTEGIRLFESEKVDIVILDYWMSGMKGTTVASELRRINAAIPIIVLSGLSDLPGEASGLVDRWFVKGSARADQLLDSISGLLDRRPA